MRLIDLDELMKYPIRLDHYDEKNGNRHFVLGIESVLEYAEALPTIDAVEVVRCKDCYWWDDEKIGWNNCGRCAEWSDVEVGMSRYTKPEDYCSHGERRSDD